MHCVSVCMVGKSVLALAIATALFLPPSAAAGGWWTSLRVDRATVVAGQRVHAHADPLHAGEGKFFVYLLSDFDESRLTRAMSEQFSPSWWSLGEATAIKVGHVAVGGSASATYLASASFRVPQLSTGTYAVMFCDDGCARPLGDVIPMTEFAVVADPMIARLATRLDRLEERTYAQAQQLLDARAEAQDARLNATGERAQMRARIHALERAAEDSRPAPWADVRWLIAGLFLGVVVGILLPRRRSHERSPGPDWHLDDDELRDLLAERDSPTSSVVRSSYG
jgi:hypothetical protein